MEALLATLAVTFVVLLVALAGLKMTHMHYRDPFTFFTGMFFFGLALMVPISFVFSRFELGEPTSFADHPLFYSFVIAGILTVVAGIFVFQHKRRKDNVFDARVKKLEAEPYGRFYIANVQDKDRKGVLLFAYDKEDEFFRDRRYRDGGFFNITNDQPDMELTTYCARRSYSKY